MTEVRLTNRDWREANAAKLVKPGHVQLAEPPEGTEWRLAPTGYLARVHADVAKWQQQPKPTFPSWPMKDFLEVVRLNPVPVPEIKPGMWIQRNDSANSASVRYVSHRVDSERGQWVTYNLKGVPIEYNPDEIGVGPDGDFYECDKPGHAGDELLGLLGVEGDSE